MAKQAATILADEISELKAENKRLAQEVQDRTLKHSENQIKMVALSQALQKIRGRRGQTASHEDNGHSAVRPSKAILELVGHNPGITQSDIIESLEARITSKSKNKRHILRTTLLRLRRDDKVKLKGGGFEVVE